MNKLLVQALMMLGGTLRGTVGGALDYLNTLLKSGFNTTKQFHQEGIAFARELGMNAKEAQAYTQVLTNRTEKLAATYGVATEQIKAIQRGISEATSRQLMLNDAQAEQFLQLNKLVGSSVTSKFTEEIMQGMGGQLETVQGAVAKAYATAAKSGLSAQKVSEKIAANLNMANKLSFRTGIDGLTRMAMQAEKVGMSLQTVEAVANNFLEIDDAISHAAQLQMLGGAAGAFGGNPMDMLYEANYDPEALQKRMTSMLGGYAQFDAKTGMASINGANQDFIRNIAKAMGIDTAEASRIAKKNAEVKFKESNINFGAYGNLTQEQRDFLINKSNVANGRTTFTTQDGKTIDLTSGQALDQKVLQEMMKYEGMSDSDIMKENARSLTSIDEKLKGIATSISAMFAKFLEGLFPKAVKDLDNIGEFTKNKLEPIAKNVGVAARGVYDWFKENKETVKTLASGVLGFLKFATEHWKILLTTLGTLKFLKFLGNAGILGKGSGIGAAARSGTSGMSWKQAKNAAKASQRTSLRNGASRWGAASKATKNLTKNVKWLGRGVKGVAGVGTVLSAWEIGSSIYDAHAKRNEIENNKALTKVQKQQQKNEVSKQEGREIGEAAGALAGGLGGAKAGAAIGTMIAPGVGTVIGGLIGGLGGALLGGFVGNKAGGATASAIAPSSTEKHAEGGIVGGSSYSGDKVLTRLNSGEMVLNFDQQNRLFNAIKNLATPQTREVSIQNIGGNTVFNRSVKSVAPIPTKIEAKPVGEKEYIYTPKRTETSSVNGNTVTVKDFNININGTLKLDGGSSFKNINMNELLNNPQFVGAIKQMVQERINSDFNGGRFDNSPSVMRGLTTQVNTYGKKA